MMTIPLSRQDLTRSAKGTENTAQSRQRRKRLQHVLYTHVNIGLLLMYCTVLLNSNALKIEQRAPIRFNMSVDTHHSVSASIPFVQDPNRVFARHCDTPSLSISGSGRKAQKNPVGTC
jgi:hypothetical protein